MKVAFIGLGSMGGHISRNLARAGVALTVFDLDPAKGEPAVRHGATRASSSAAAATGADVVITSLPNPPIVERVLLGGVLDAMPGGALWIDMSTSVPAVAERVRERGAARGIRVLDAPLGGMAKAADRGTLQIFVGGAKEDFDAARPLLDIVADPERVLHVGPHGAGYAVKLMINMLWFVQLVGIAEALSVGTGAGVDLAVLHRSLVASSANSLLLERDLLPLLTDGDYEEGFAIALACKDAGLAVDLARDVRVPVELSALTEQIFRRALARFGDLAGEMTPVRLYEQITGRELRMGAAS